MASPTKSITTRTGHMSKADIDRRLEYKAKLRGDSDKMHNFFDLVGYEYKKILKRKSVWVMLVLGVLIAVVTCAGVLIGDYYEDGIAFESQYEGMIKDRTYARKLAGRLLDKDLLIEAAEGYNRFLVIMYTTAMIGSFIAAICVAPIFAGEYTSGADQLVLASIHGKKTLIWAKIFTGISLSILFCLSLIVITYLQCMFTYGFDGADAVWQLLMPMSPYPLTIGEVALIFVICILCANLFCTMITITFLHLFSIKKYTILI